MMEYDIICIGAGSGGLNIAGFMNTVGFKVLLVDKSDPHIGGDCLNWGCVPSKALIHISRMVYDAKEVSPFGLTVTGEIDLKKVMDYVRSKQDVIRAHENADYFRKKGMDVALGVAKFTGMNEIEVAGKKYTAKKIVLATGARPRIPPIPGIDKVNYQTNETIFNMEKLPQKFIVIGGGPIGIELGQVFNRLGSSVTVIDMVSKFLPKESEEIGAILHKQLVKEGMKFLFETKIKEFPSASSVIIEDKQGNTKTLEFDRVLISVGRQLNIDNLDIEKAGIEKEGYKLKVDEYLRTTNKNVLTCGDVAGSYQFTHAAELHAGLLINNFFKPVKKKLNNDFLSWVTYTYPEIATWGLNEQQLKDRNINYEKLSLGFSDDDRAIVDDFTSGKLIVYLSKNKIIGGSMVTPNAGELFQELSLAMSAKLDIKHLFYKVYPYPTAARNNKKIISKIFSRKLTPIAKKIMKFLYYRGFR